MIAGTVNVVGTLVTLLCGVLLFRGYVRVKRRLLLWSALCFFGLSISNLLLLLDLVVFPAVDLYPWRLLTATVAMMLLLYGLIWEGE